MSSAYNIDLGRWSQMTIFEQMGNIGSEVGRSFSAKRRKDETGSAAATERAIDLFNATIQSLIKNKSKQTKEVLRAKEIYLSTMFSKNVEPSEFDSLEKYFTQFAIAARINR